MSSRRFVIPQHGPRFAGIRQVDSRRVSRVSIDIARIRRVVASTVQEALASSFAHNSKLALASHLAYWHKFCGTMKIDAETCFQAHVDGLTPAVRDAENNIICSFLAYVVRFPRGGQRQNTAKYAAQMLASVRSYYEDRIGRLPGFDATGKASGRIHAMQKGLRKIARSVAIHRMRAVKDRLNLTGNATHRAL